MLNLIPARSQALSYGNSTSIVNLNSVNGGRFEMVLRASDIKRLAWPFDQTLSFRCLLSAVADQHSGTGVKKLIIVSWAPYEYLLTLFAHAR